MSYTSRIEFKKDGGVWLELPEQLQPKTPDQLLEEAAKDQLPGTELRLIQRYEPGNDYNYPPPQGNAAKLTKMSRWEVKIIIKQHGQRHQVDICVITNLLENDIKDAIEDVYSKKGHTCICISAIERAENMFLLEDPSRQTQKVEFKVEELAK